MKQVIALADQIAALGRLDPDHRRKRRRQGSDGALRAQEIQAQGQALHRRQLRGDPRTICWRANCSATRKARSPARSARRIGKFEEADGGTLLLDEISEMDLRLQSKLLRALQERVIDRVGGGKPVPVNIRVLATSNRDLSRLVRAGEFREDLLYRLNVVNLRIPPLRERKDDLAALAQLLHREIRQRQRPPCPALCRSDALAQVLAHAWPGNVRELENAMHRAVLLGERTRTSAPKPSARRTARRLAHAATHSARRLKPAKPPRARWLAAPSRKSNRI